MNARERANFALFVLVITVSYCLTLFGIYVGLTRLFGFSREVSLFITFSTFLFSIPQIIIGMSLYYKRKYSTRVSKPSENQEKGKPLPSRLLTMQFMIAGFFAQYKAYTSFISDANMALTILFGLVGVLIPIWVAIRSQPHGEQLVYKWKNRYIGN